MCCAHIIHRYQVARNGDCDRSHLVATAQNMARRGAMHAGKLEAVDSTTVSEQSRFYQNPKMPFRIISNFAFAKFQAVRPTTASSRLLPPSWHFLHSNREILECNCTATVGVPLKSPWALTMPPVGAPWAKFEAPVAYLVTLVFF